MILRAIMPVAGLLAISIGFLVYASPSHFDQVSGKAIMPFGGVMIATILLPSNRAMDIVRKIMIAPILL